MGSGHQVSRAIERKTVGWQGCGHCHPPPPVEQASLRAVYAPRFPARARLTTLWATVGGGSASPDDAVPAALAVRPLSAAELCELREVYVMRSAAPPHASLLLPCHAPLAGVAGAAGVAGVAGLTGAAAAEEEAAAADAATELEHRYCCLVPSGYGRNNDGPGTTQHYDGLLLLSTRARYCSAGPGTTQRYSGPGTRSTCTMLHASGAAAAVVLSSSTRQGREVVVRRAACACTSTRALRTRPLVE